MLDGRKLAGILVEAGVDFAIVGIGLNVHSTAFPAELGDTATSLALSLGEAPSRADLLASIIQRFAIRHQGIGGDFPQLVEAIHQRCALSGKRVLLQTSGGPKSGTVKGIGAGGELLLETGLGIEALIQADEVRILES